MARKLSLRDAVPPIVTECPRPFYRRRIALTKPKRAKHAKCGGPSVERRREWR